MGTFHVLDNERISAILFQELQQAWPDIDVKMGYEALEKLPYLVGFSSASVGHDFHSCRRQPLLRNPYVCLLVLLARCHELWDHHRP